MDFNLDAYLARIGYAGPRDASLSTLAGLHALHPAAIPFETIDPLLGRPVSVDIADVAAKLVDAGRGGYCFEQNALMRAALEDLGFQVTPLIARVVWMAPPDAPLGPRNHMLLRVDIAGEPFVADVGFGGHLASAPLRLQAGLEQETREARLRFTEADGVWTAETHLPDGWVRMYRFILEPAEASDYLVSNWYTSTHPAFPLTTNLVAERLTAEARTSVFNTRLTRRRPGHPAEVIELETAVDLARAFQQDLGLPPDDAEAVFARLPRG
jgi:N-hydroxyarylamine O-acetyltransferase